VAVGRIDERDVEAFGAGIGLGLIEPLIGGKGVLLDFDDGNRDRLSFGGNDHAQGEIGAPLGAAAGLAGDQFDGASCLFALDVVFGPAAGVEGRIHQLCVCVGFR